MNYVELHLGDYAEATAHLTFVEDAAYMRLLRKYYATESALPADKKACQRLVGARSKEEREAVDSMLDEFFQLGDDGWHNKRADGEISRYRDKQAKAKRSATTRWDAAKAQCQGNANAMRTHNNSDANALPTQCEGNAHQSPVTSHQSPINTREPTVLVEAAPSPPRRAACPTEEIIDLYHRHLPMLPRVEIINDARRKHVSARWAHVVTDPGHAKSEDPRKAALEFFGWYFDHAGKSDFLTGRSKDWRADFDFLMTASKFTKVVEGHYHRSAA